MFVCNLFPEMDRIVFRPAEKTSHATAMKRGAYTLRATAGPILRNHRLFCESDVISDPKLWGPASYTPARRLDLVHARDILAPPLMLASLPLRDVIVRPAHTRIWIRLCFFARPEHRCEFMAQKRYGTAQFGVPEMV